jgi:HEAT repeat protein
MSVPDLPELRRLLAGVVYHRAGSCFEGLDVFRQLLENDPDGHVQRFLRGALRRLQGKKAGGVAYALAEHYRKVGDLKGIERLFAAGDADVRESVLNALWGEPGSNPAMGPGIVRLAVAAADDPAPGVRVEVGFVLQNQSAWGVDVSAGVEPLRRLLADNDAGVRRQAAYAVGNLARRRYDLARHVAPLRRNAKHRDVFVREPAAWALWRLSRGGYDIGSAVPELVRLLTDDSDWSDPRKNAAGALLDHSKKSAANREQVSRQLRGVRLDATRKEIKTFLARFEELK